MNVERTALKLMIPVAADIRIHCARIAFSVGVDNSYTYDI